MSDVSIIGAESLAVANGSMLDDLADVLTEVDPFIYLALFADAGMAGSLLSELAKLEESPLAFEHWRVAVADGRPVGVCVRQARRLHPMGDRWKLLGLAPSARDACMRYLSEIREDTADGSVYVMALATHPGFRRCGVATALLRDSVCDAGTTTDAYLDVLASNEPAIRLYESLGFHVYDEVDGYAYDESAPHVLRMTTAPSR